MQEIIRKIWKMKKSNPGMDVREFCDRILSLPESKRLANQKEGDGVGPVDDQDPGV
jgi:hypothetical protein